MAPIDKIRLNLDAISRPASTGIAIRPPVHVKVDRGSLVDRLIVAIGRTPPEEEL